MDIILLRIILSIILLRIVLGWWTVDIILLSIVLLDSAWMVDSGYHPLKHHPLRIVLGWWTVDVILLSIFLV